MASYKGERVFPDGILPFYPDDDTSQFTFVVQTSFGVDFGTRQSVKNFHELFGWVYRHYPEKEFQIIPFSFDLEYGGVKAYLMVEQPTKKQKAEQ